MLGEYNDQNCVEARGISSNPKNPIRRSETFRKTTADRWDPESVVTFEEM